MFGDDPDRDASVFNSILSDDEAISFDFGCETLRLAASCQGFVSLTAFLDFFY